MKHLRTELLTERRRTDASNEMTSVKSPGATTIRVSRKVLKRVDAEAEANRLSRNELIILLLDRYLRSRTGEGIDEIDPEYAAFLKTKRRQR